MVPFIYYVAGSTAGYFPPAYSYSPGGLYVKFDSSLDGPSKLANIYSRSDINWEWQSIACSTNGQFAYASAEYGTFRPGGIDSTIFTSTNFGLTWYPLTNNFWAESLAVSGDGGHLLALQNIGSIYQSADFGNTWIQLQNAPTNAAWSSAAMSADCTKIIAVVIDQGPYISHDSGQTWTRSTNINGIVAGATWSSCASSSDGQKLFARARIYRPGGYEDIIVGSSDAGVSWTSKTSATSPCLVIGVACSSDGNRIVAGQACGSILTSGDTGSSWVRQLETSRLDGLAALASSADGTKILTTDNSSVCTIGLYSYDTLSGAPYSGCELTYVGNGQWQITSSPAGGSSL